MDTPRKRLMHLIEKKKKKHSFFYRLATALICRVAGKNERFGKEYLDIFQSGLVWSSKTSRTANDVILASCDDVYYRDFAIPLIKSAEALKLHHVFHIHLLEPSDETVLHIKNLANQLGHVRITFTTDECRLAERLENRSIYYTVARFLLAPLLLDQGVQRLLIIDVDAVMKNSPWEFFDERHSRASGAFIFRPHERRPWRKVMACAVLYNSSQHSYVLADLFARAAAATLKWTPRYHIDQMIPAYLSKILRRRGPAYRPLEIPHGLMGFNYEPGAAFWTIKGWNSNNGTKFEAAQKELSLT